jgi:NAD(P)-dependent dehydrogenase (short-subunit alcohol dehydrogenase family)
MQASVSGEVSVRPQTVFITGGNTGIGFETAKNLCKKGWDVTIGCRDESRAKAAIQKIRAEVPNAVIKDMSLDLADLSSVRDCSKQLLDSGVKFDVLLNNAGVMFTPKMETKDGFEYQLGVNHLGHFLLTNMILPTLMGGDRPGHIINVASEAHRFASTMELGDINYDKSYNAQTSYGRSKLANVMFTYELARRLKPSDGVRVNCLHPGVVATELGRYMVDNPILALLVPLATPFFKTPAQGAETSLFLATSNEASIQSSKYFSDCRPTKTTALSYDLEVSKKLWDVSAELTKLKETVASTTLVSA